MINLPQRKTKPRKIGITAITDVGTPVTTLKSHLESYADFIDIAKFGVGSAFVDPNLEEKLSIYKEYNVMCYLGGTLFEKFYHSNSIKEYIKYLKQLDINSVEISCGSVDIDLKLRVDLVKQFIDSGITNVFSEVGSKDVDSIMAPYEWVTEINTLLDAGCNFVITEGRDSASAGIYRRNGEMREGLLKEILANTPTDKLIFEAPKGQGQMMFIKKIGANVNLGNVSINDLLLLEAQRNGLRYETFNVTD